MSYNYKQQLTHLDHSLTFWQLFCIGGASMGLSGIVLGGGWVKIYGVGSSLISCWIGNLCLWVMGIIILEMTWNNRSNAIENVKTYLGKIGAVIAALILIASFVVWYTLQLSESTKALETLLQNHIGWPSDRSIRLGAALGIFIAFLSLKGIRMIKWIAVFIFPFMFLYNAYLIWISGNFLQTSFGNWVPSTSGIALVVACYLPGIINLPTFFRHSRSKADAIFGLTMILLIFVIFESLSILAGISSSHDLFASLLSNVSISFSLVLAVVFVLATLIGANIVNIYFASAGWEMIIPRVAGPKEFAIVGLIGTLVYTFVQLSPSMLFLVNLCTNLMATLGTVLLFDFLIRVFIKHRPRAWEKLISLSCWIIGSIATTITLFFFPDNPSRSMITGIIITTLSFFLVLLMEEIIWSIKNLKTSKN